ncbi:MAG: hypothetical protein HQ503_11870 [Rhodospirillales bacterium]|nr:hypothetical protein [Rhodospirillales bacterium]
MEEVVIEALVNGVAIPLAAALVLTGALRFSIGVPLAGAAISIAFLAGYALSFGWPLFPLNSASQKLTYIALVGAGLGVAIDSLRAHDKFRLALILIWPAAIAGWLGWQQLVSLSGESVIAIAVCWAAGVFVMARLDGKTTSQSTPTILLLSAAIGLAAVAFFGSNASVAQLAGTLAAATGGFLLWNWPVARYPLGSAGLLGGAGALLSLGFILVLFSEDTSRAALALILLIFLGPLLAARLPFGRHQKFGPVMLGLVSAVPALAAAALSFFTGQDNF